MTALTPEEPHPKAKDLIRQLQALRHRPPTIGTWSSPHGPGPWQPRPQP